MALDILSDDSAADFDAEHPSHAYLSDSEPHESIPHEPLIQIDADHTEFEEAYPDTNSFHSQMDWEIGGWENNFGVSDEADTDDAAGEAELQAQMTALAMGDENDDHFTDENTDVEAEIIPQGLLFLLVKKYLH